MATFELVLIMGAAVLLSSFLDQILPRVSPPLIQIALGVVIALIIPSDFDATLNPEFFLVLFIAPLLFKDAREADKAGLWRNRLSILSLAVGLVIAIMLVVGFAVNALIPSIPLAAALALGAALGPTDAVAVTSLSGTAKLGKHERSLLQGEALINDATGVVSFQFAIAAAVTGTFAVAEASVEFAISFFGGIALGAALAWLAHQITRKVNDVGLDNPTFHVLFDVMLPFLVFLISEALGVSGILAVVAAGLVSSGLTSNVIGPTNARFNLVTSNVWNILAFALNGVVFVMLGMQLPDAVSSKWADISIDNTLLIAYVVVFTLILVGTRFAWLYVMNRFSARRIRSKGGTPPAHRAILRSALVSTVGGPKGAITLSIVFSIPILAGEVAFPQRSLIIFIASGVILCTLLIANFLLPTLCPIPPEEKKAPETDEEVAEGKIAVLRNVVQRLMELRDDRNSREITSVIRGYNERISRVRTEADMDSSDIVALRLKVNERQSDALARIRRERGGGRIDLDVAHGFIHLARSRRLLEHHAHYGRVIVLIVSHFPTFLRVVWDNISTGFKRIVGIEARPRTFQARIAMEEAAIEYLDQVMESDTSQIPYEVVLELANRHRNALTAFRGLAAANGTAIIGARLANETTEAERLAYQIELDEISQLYDEGTISRATAKHMRDNVYLMLVDLEES